MFDRYNPKQLNAALALLLKAVESDSSLKQNGNLRVDVVDLAQSMMGNAFIVHLDALNASLLAQSPPSPAAIKVGQAFEVSSRATRCTID